MHRAQLDGLVAGEPPHDGVQNILRQLVKRAHRGRGTLCTASAPNGRGSSMLCLKEGVGVQCMILRAQSCVILRAHRLEFEVSPASMLLLHGDALRRGTGQRSLAAAMPRAVPLPQTQLQKPRQTSNALQMQQAGTASERALQAVG